MTDPLTALKRAATAAAACAALVAATPALASAQIVTSPQPNTPDASPTTQISFLGATASQLGAVSVVGSRSGGHSGRLIAYASARGVSFVPDRAFRDGERVTVTATRAHLHFQFTVAGTVHPSSAALVTAAQVNTHGAWNFESSPLHPPSVRVTAASSSATPGDIFVAPIRGPSTTPGAFVGQVGPLILDAQGRPIWMDPLPRGQWGMNFHPQTYQGAPVLTWWQGHVSTQGIGTSGEDVIANSSYQTIATISSVNGYVPDLHDFVITPQGQALITAYRAVRKDVSAYHGSHTGQVWDSVVQEVDIKTGAVMFEWHPLAHISLHESYTIPVSGYVWDPYHVNSIDMDSAGNFLISARNTWAVYYVRASDGAVLWRLNGNRSTFRMGRGAGFAYQHDARFLPNGEISIFDDEAAPPVGRRSRGIIVRLDMTHRTATLVHAYVHPGVLSGSQGNTQVLPNGNAFEGWGAAPFFSEYSRGGRLLFDAHFHGADETYRAFRAPWVGHPPGPPSVAAHGRSVFASWNGATEVASWRVLAGPDANHLAPAGTTGRQGFETTINSRSGGPYYAVQALDSSGHVLGTSPAVHG